LNHKPKHGSISVEGSMGSITGVGLTMLKSKSYNPSTPLVFGRGASLNGRDVVGNLADGEKK
jgi:hypothetical protein